MITQDNRHVQKTK